MSISKSILTTTALFFALLSVGSAFSIAPRRVRISSSSSSQLKMAWGLQKVGQSIISINTQTVEVPVNSPDSIFGRRTSTTGNDERNEHSVSEEEHFESLSTLDLNFRKQGLLQGLSDHWGTAESLERIGSASAFEGLLPSSKSGISMKAGGLTEEWDFDFGN